MYFRVNFINRFVNMFIDIGNLFLIIIKDLVEILEVKVGEIKVDLSFFDGGDIIVYGKVDVIFRVKGGNII